MSQLTIDESKIDYRVRGQINVRGKLVDIPAIYKGKAITTLFPISTKKAKEIINCSRVKPAEIYPGRSLLSLTLFNFYWSPVGPYTELVPSIPVFYSATYKIPLFPLLFYKSLKDFGFFVIDILQSTDIAIEHGNLLTGYPHNPNLIDVIFQEKGGRINIKAIGGGKDICALSIKKPVKEKIAKEMYMTYFTKDKDLFEIRMDIYGIESSVWGCKLNLGDHATSNLIKDLKPSVNSIQTRYFRDVIEINPVTKRIL
ncbi:MAG: hypothetical protein V1892_01810 [bacterium]